MHLVNRMFEQEDIENNFNELTVSYFNKEGNIRLKKYKLTEEQCSNWRICSESDSKKSDQFRNWDGKAVKKVKDKRLQKFSIYEFINNLYKSASLDMLCTCEFLLL